MMSLVKKIPLLIIVYGCYQGYLLWDAFQQKYAELESQIPVVQSKITRARKEQKEIKAYIKDIEQAKKDIEIVAQEVESLQRKLPESIKDTENLALLGDLAKDINIKNVYLSPGIEVNQGFYFTKRYEMSATGTFLQFLVYAEKISSSERLFNVRKFELIKNEKNQRGRFQLVNGKIELEAYRYNPNHREERGIKQIEEVTKKPAPKVKGAKRKAKAKK